MNCAGKRNLCVMKSSAISIKPEPTFVAVFAVVIWFLPSVILGLLLVHKP